MDFNTNGAVFVSEASSDAERMASSAIVVKKSPPADLLVGETLAHSSIAFLISVGMYTCHANLKVPCMKSIASK